MNNRYFLPMVGMVLLPLFLLAYQFTIPAEDSVILYEYAKNLATKGVITYGGADTPIEGATDFLWMLFIAAFKKIGIPEFLSALLLNFVGVMILVALVNSLRAKLVVALGLLSTAYLYSSLSGFSPIFFSAAYCWCFYLVLQKKSGLYFSILILCLIRPDGVVWGAGLVLFRLLDVQTARKKEIIELIKYLVIPGLAYFLWRAWYFSEWLPLPFLVKASGERDLFLVWNRSLIAVGVALIPALIAIILVKDRRRYLKQLIILFILPCMFYAAMKLEQNIGNRFLAPMFFGTALLLSYSDRLITLIGFVFTSALFAIPASVLTLGDLLDSRDENIYYIARDLNSLNGKMLVTEAGKLAYYSNWLTHDSWGLNTPRFAHANISNADLLKENYDLIVGHCTIALLKNKVPERVYQDKSWENQCKVLVSYIQSENYNVFLVPFMRAGAAGSSLKRKFGMSGVNPGYGRFYIYAISPTYKNSAELSNLLERHGGIKYPPSGVSLGQP